MSRKVGWVIVLTILVVSAGMAQARASDSELSGTVRSESGQAVANAQVSVTTVAGGEAHSVQTDSAGEYTIRGLPPGNYTVSVSAPGYSGQSNHVSLAAGVTQNLEVKLTPSLSLSSLGFPTVQTQGNAREQALLNKRSHMLQIHQKLGLITAIPLAATLLAATQAGGHHSSSTGRDVHIALGSATTGLYAATAYYAIFAPKIPGAKPHGPTRFHEVMAFIHGPGMVLTPVLGAMADSQLNQGERVHGIAKYHGEVAIITAAAYGVALLSETKPNWIPGLGHKVSALLDLHHSSGEQPAASTAEPPDLRASIAH